VVDEEAPDGCCVSGSGTAVSGLSALYLHQQRRLVLVHADGGLEVELRDREWEVATVSPVATATSAPTHWAPFGLLDMINGGGAILASRLVVAFGRPPTAHVQLRGTGLFGAYCLPRPRAVRVDGQPLEFVYDSVSGLLQVPMVRSANGAELTVEFPGRFRRRFGGARAAGAAEQRAASA
jgi:raffinose synthase